jgi:phthalate 4,5-dioxygenase oxygenase subunit
VAMQESMGTIADRTNEHLGSADAAVIAARRRLLAEAKALAAADGAATPSGLDPSQQRVRSASMILPRDVPWVEATAESRKAAEAHYHQYQ